MVDRVMKACGASFSEIDRIAVTTGPGTFTGQRVGLAFARALALALKRPAIGVTTLDAMAAEALSKTNTAPWSIAAADAKRGEIYLGARIAEKSLLAPILVPLADAVPQLAPLIEHNGKIVVLCGTAADMLKPLLQKAGVDPTDSTLRQPDAVWVARLSE